MSNSYRNSYSYTWSIENFSFCNQENGRPIEASFVDENVSEQEWFLMLYPRGEGEESVGFISCFLEMRQNKNHKDFRYGFKIEFIGGSGKKLKTLDGNLTLKPTKKMFTWGSSEMLEIEEVMQDIESSLNDTLTVCCSVYGINSKKPLTDGYAERTRIFVDCLTYRWSAQSGIGQLFQETATFQKNTSFKIVVSRTPLLLVTKLNVSITKLTSYLATCHFVKCKIALLDNVQEFEICSEKASHLFDSSSKTWDFSSNIISSELSNRTCNEVTFFCEFLYSNGDTESLCANNFQIPNTYSTFKQDFQNIFSNKKFSDIKLRIDNHIIEAHKAVLAARSPIFSAMFDQNKSEAPLKILDIKNIDKNSLNLFLKFLYSDTMSEIDFEEAKTLIFVAEKYKVLSLKLKCSSVLNSGKTEKNVCELLTIADLVSDIKLKSSAIDFILANTGKVLSSTYWLSWMKNHMELASQIFFELTSTACISRYDHQQEKRRRIR